MKWDSPTSIASRFAAPVAIAAPATPIFSGYTISQSPKMFAAVQVKETASDSPGFPSFLAKQLKHGPIMVDMRKTEYQKM